MAALPEDYKLSLSDLTELTFIVRPQMDIFDRYHTLEIHDTVSRKVAGMCLY